MPTETARTLADVPLQPHEREMLQRLMAAIRRRFGDILVEARLFGSKARGDSDPESDIDIWLLLERELTREERDELTDLEVDLDLEYGTVTQLTVRPRWLWENTGYPRTGFAQALLAEGARL